MSLEELLFLSFLPLNNMSTDISTHPQQIHNNPVRPDDRRTGLCLKLCNEHITNITNNTWKAAALTGFTACCCHLLTTVQLSWL